MTINYQVISRAVGGGLGSRIFNRNERLDVKKPGPFYKNSANNFFLDKVRNIYSRVYLYSTVTASLKSLK